MLGLLYRRLLAALFCLTLCTFLAAQTSSPIDLDAQLPMDQKITTGTLDNGLRYYIRENHKPENRAELRLGVNVGSIVEDDDQRGLAHFIEHMAFNGTGNLPKQEIVDYLESIGMKFGPDINAYTSFDETVYMLQVPTDQPEILEQAFFIFKEWANNVAFEPEEIEKERGVVVEEWRLRRGARARMFDKQFPILLKDSKYAQRLPIGKKETLETAPRETFLRYYRDWYRPDLMTIVAIGDFDTEQIKAYIKETFSGLHNPETPRERPRYEVPGHEETLYAYASDVEATNTRISIYHKRDAREEGTARAYRRSLVEALYNGILNNRLTELLQKAEPPFLFGYAGDSDLVRTEEAYVMGAVVADNGIPTGLDALLTEAERLRRFGFTQSELDRQKTEMLRSIEQAYNERDKTESDSYAAEYLRNYFSGEPVPGIEYEFSLYNLFIPEISLQEVNALAGKSLSGKNRVIMVNQPEKEGAEQPEKESLLQQFAEVESKDLQPYEDKVSDEPLVQSPPQRGQIVADTTYDDLQLTEWRLSNDVRVILKPTDFKNDEILMSAFSPGGNSLASDQNFVSALAAPPIIRESGLGNFDAITLQKKLSGKLVSVSPWISDLREGFSGRVSPKDLETLFELVYLYFNAPRRDSTAYLSWRSRVIESLRNRHASPNAAYRDTISVTMSQHHFRTRPWSEEILSEMDLSVAYRIFQDRFADASDFTFVFVGAFEIDAIKPHILTYLGGLPDRDREERWRDVGIRPPQGVIEKTVHRGLEQKSQVTLIFTGPFEWERQNRYELQSMCRAFQIKLREVLREDKGGTYGVGVWPTTTRDPREEYSINVAFGCAPQRVEELSAAVFQQIDSLQTYGTTEKYLQKVKETQLRSRETDLQENGFWLRALRTIYQYDLDPRTILTYEELVDSLTLERIQKAAQKYFDLSNYVKVVLYPEEKKS